MLLGHDHEMVNAFASRSAVGVFDGPFSGLLTGYSTLFGEIGFYPDRR
jgi:hypothetical protein